MFTTDQNSGSDEGRYHADGKAESIMTVVEVAEFLRVHRSTVTRLAMSGELISHRIGNRRLFKTSDVWRFFDRQRVQLCDDQEK